MTSSQFAELADSFYDKDGRPIHATTTPTSVNAIGGGGSEPFNPNAHSTTSSTFTSAFDADQVDVNAVRARQTQKRSNNNNNNNNNNFRNSNSNSNSNSNPNSNSKSKLKSNGLCHYHDKFGSEARNCVNGCKRWSAHQGNAKASKQVT